MTDALGMVSTSRDPRAPHPRRPCAIRSHPLWGPGRCAYGRVMSRASILLGTSVGLLLGLLANACSDDDGGGVTPGACDSIMDACHSKDDGSDEFINGCHTHAHDGDDAVCSSELQACLDACNAAPDVGTGGHTEDTGHDDHDHTGTTGHHESTGHDSTGHDSTGHHESTGAHASTGHQETSSTGADDSSQASCEELGSVCHDVADAMGVMCHDIGHAGDEAACAKVWVECIEHCTA